MQTLSRLSTPINTFTLVYIKPLVRTTLDDEPVGGFLSLREGRSFGQTDTPKRDRGHGWRPRKVGPAATGRRPWPGRRDLQRDLPRKRLRPKPLMRTTVGVGRAARRRGARAAAV